MEYLYNIFAVLISLVIAILVASLFGGIKTFCNIEKRNERYSSIDGLRGYLALFVFFHHFVITWYWKNTGYWARPPEDYYQNFGKVGVSVFFMITGFLFISKLFKSHKGVDWLKLFESRFFRIFPLYVFVLSIVFLIVAFESGFNLNVEVYKLVIDVSRWFIFFGASINEYENTKIIIAGVDWSLKYEWIFYLSLPFLFMVIRFGIFFVMLFTFLIFLLFLYPFQFHSINTGYFFLFFVGGFVYYISNHNSLNCYPVNNFFNSSVCFLLLVFSMFYSETMNLLHVLMIAAFFLLIALGNNIFGILSIKGSLILGEISYSIYLIHGLVLFVLFSICDVIDLSVIEFRNYILLMPVVSALVVFFSCITFVFIEKNGVMIGGKYFISKSIYKIFRINLN